MDLAGEQFETIVILFGTDHSHVNSSETQFKNPKVFNDSKISNLTLNLEQLGFPFQSMICNQYMVARGTI